MNPSVLTYFTYKSPLGPFSIASNGFAITDMVLGECPLRGEKKPIELTNRASTQLQEYFAGKRTFFDLPLDPTGTPFQKQVWEAIQVIPYGQTRSYAEVARFIGKPTAYRAVGMAIKKNPLTVLIPSHRVVSAKGNPLGSAGYSRIQKHLLQLEQHHS